MTKSKIKQNPYAWFYIRQIKLMEEQRQRWLKHPDQFIKDLTGIMFTLNKNISIEDKMKLERELEG